MILRFSAPILLLLALLPSGCAGKGSREPAGEKGASEPDVVWVELWSSQSNWGPYTPEHPLNQIYIEELGIGLRGPQISWNGGKDYMEKLNRAILSGELPHVFQPWLGIENDLAKKGLIMPLDELLPSYAPYLWENISPSVWDMVRANSPDGGIYYIPQVWNGVTLTASVRTDWLDRVGMSLPHTISEYEEVLEAFKNSDANGNGDPSDEIPTSAREYGRWMDHHFAPFGASIYEGNPVFDLYEGELTYSGITPAMKAALAWNRELFAKGLLDGETFVNSRSRWLEKIQSDRVGVFFFGPLWLTNKVLPGIQEKNPEVDLTRLPLLKAPGYEGFYCAKSYQAQGFVFSSQDRNKVIAALRLLEFMENPATGKKYPGGFPGWDVTIEKGVPKPMIRPAGWALQPAVIIDSPENRENQWALHLSDPGIGKLYRISLKLARASMKDTRQIAGQGLPSSIYDGYTKMENHELFHEYASLIIMGVYEMDRFDEFVDKWHAQGGDVVTSRARAVQ